MIPVREDSEVVIIHPDLIQFDGCFIHDAPKIKHTIFVQTFDVKNNCFDLLRKAVPRKKKRCDSRTVP